MGVVASIRLRGQGGRHRGVGRASPIGAGQEPAAGGPVVHEQEVHQTGGDQAGVPPHGGHDEGDRDADTHGDERCRVPPSVGAVLVVERVQVQSPAADDVVVDHHHREDRPQERGVDLDEELQAVGGLVTDQHPREGRHGEQPDQDRGHLEGQLEDVHEHVGRRHDVVEDVRGDLGEGDEQQGDDQQGVLSVALPKTLIGSTAPVAPETMNPIMPMNSVTGRIDVV